MRRLTLAVLALCSPLLMGAITVGDLHVPDRLTVATTWNTLTLPARTDYLLIRPITITGYYAVGCTDAAALGSVDYLTLTADTPIVIAVNSVSRHGAVCLAGSGAGTIEVIPLSKGL